MDSRLGLLLVSLGLVYGHASGDGVSSFDLLSRALERCSADEDAVSCLKVKAVNLLDRASSMDSLPVSEFLTITKDPSVQSLPATPQTVDLEASLPRDLGKKNSLLDQMIQEKLATYLETRTIQLSMPKGVFEGRKKYGGKKGGGIFLVFGAFAYMLMQVALGKIAVIAGKALLVGKIALLLASILGLKILLSHKEEGHASQVIYAEPEHHGGWGRSLRPSSGHAQEVVYRRHRPASKQ